MATDRSYNIILITVDDLGWADLGCYGSKFYETPQIDRLSRMSSVFNQAYASASVCSPTRAALMTGKYPARLGITDWIRAEFQGGGTHDVIGHDTITGRRLVCPKNPFHLNLEEVTLAEYLGAAGYVSAHVGKWHLGTKSYYPENQGFHVNVAGCDYGEPPSYFDPYIRIPRHPSGDTLLGFPTMEPRQPGEYLTDREGFEAIKFIKENSHHSFFLNLSHYAVHTPIQAKESLIEKYQAKKPDHQKSAAYAAMLESVDDVMGNILGTLEELDILRKTIIIFTSDNGGLLRDYATSNHPLRSGKGYPYEGGIRVPLIIYHPDVQGGKRLDTPVASMDILPTVLSMTYVRTTINTLDGADLSGLIIRKENLPQRSLIWHFPHYRYPDIQPYSIIRDGPWKMIMFYDDNRVELYNLKDDASETNELAKLKPEIVQAMRHSLITQLEEMDAKMPLVLSSSQKL